MNVIIKSLKIEISTPSDKTEISKLNQNHALFVNIDSCFILNIHLNSSSYIKITSCRKVNNLKVIRSAFIKSVHAWMDVQN